MQILKVLIATIVIILFSQSLFSMDEAVQINSSKNVEISIVSGFLTFDKSIVTNIRGYSYSRLQFPAEITDDFPSNPIIQLELLYLNSLIDIGISLTNYSTGSRVYHADYSGEYLHDVVLTNFEYGAIVKARVSKGNNPFGAQIVGRVGRAKMWIKSNQFIRIYNESSKLNEVFDYSTTFTEVGVRLNYSISNFTALLGFAVYYEPFTELNNGMTSLRALLGVGYKL